MQTSFLPFFESFELCHFVTLFLCSSPWKIFFGKREKLLSKERGAEGRFPDPKRRKKLLRVLRRLAKVFFRKEKNGTPENELSAIKKT